MGKIFQFRYLKDVYELNNSPALEIFELIEVTKSGQEDGRALARIGMISFADYIAFNQLQWKRGVSIDSEVQFDFRVFLCATHIIYRTYQITRNKV